MRFVVIFEEGSDMAAVRERHEPAHLAFLEQHRQEIPRPEACGKSMVALM